MELYLKNKRALVTGASRGLGFATARTLAQEGAQVMINSRDAQRLQAAVDRLNNETGAKVYGHAADVSNASAAAELVNVTAETLGGLDVLVCNAGGPPPGEFENFGEADWQRAFELSFMSNVHLIKAALPFLRKSEVASVLTITSVSVKQPIPNLILSNAIRSATIGLTKSLALDLGKEGIRFNSILPSYTETERITQLLTARSMNNNSTIEQEAAILASSSPLGRIATPEEFASVAVFLLSPRASYITGLMLPVDGGMLKGVY